MGAARLLDMSLISRKWRTPRGDDLNKEKSEKI